MQRNEYIALGLWATGIVLIGAEIYLEREIKRVKKLQKEEKQRQKEIINIQANFWPNLEKILREAHEHESRAAEASKRDTSHSFSMPRRTSLSMPPQAHAFMRDSLGAVKPISIPKT